jgi:hypothetical protein
MSQLGNLRLRKRLSPSSVSPEFAQKRKVQRNASGELTGCIVLHNWEISLANLAASNLKRSRTLPNRSREDRIRDWQLKRPR